MCNKCFVEDTPDRGTICLNNGGYLLNFKTCGGCGSKAFIKNINRKTTEEDDGNKEIVTLTHTCQECQHVICDHRWEFEVVDDKYQQYSMDCQLCGHGEDTKTIDPDDAPELNRYNEN